MPKRAILIMAKRPFPGRTKTRLSPPLTLTESADLYACFLADVMEKVANLDGIDAGIAFAPAEEAPFFRELAPDFLLVPQQGDTLGERLDFVLSQTLANGYDQVAAINSDGPTLPSTYLQSAFATLDDPVIDAVFGPTEDGGYYLIGVKQPQPHLVREVQMSTPRVMADTLALAEKHGTRTALLPTWYDVDEGEDLARLSGDLVNKPELARKTADFLHTLSFNAKGRRGEE